MTFPYSMWGKRYVDEVEGVQLPCHAPALSPPSLACIYYTVIMHFMGYTLLITEQCSCCQREDNRRMSLCPE